MPLDALAIVLVAAVREVGVVFATIGGMVFLHEKVGPGRLIGSVVVALGVALVVARLTTPVID